MALSHSHIASLLLKKLNQQLTAEEADELEQWRITSPATEKKYLELSSLYTLQQKRREYAEAKYRAENMENHRPVISLWKRGWIKYAAAILLMIGGLSIYFIISKRSAPQIAQIESPSIKKDILPGTNHAILTLSDGKKVELNNNTSETITDGSLSITNHEGQLNYLNPANTLRGGASSRSEEGVGEASSATNTMTTPRGAQYQLTLSDGSKIWLNAASSITYPVTFSSKTREVKITGEVYFEIAQNKEKPFIVKEDFSPSSPFKKGGYDDAPNATSRGGFSIAVLGTSFNVNTYPDEPYSKTTLVDGSIKINNLILHPFQAFTGGKITTTNMAKDLAWKNGYFNFDGADLPAVMRQLSRWYDIDIKYSSKIPNRKFAGELSRSLTLQQILDILKDININFELTGRTLFVK